MRDNRQSYTSIRISSWKLNYDFAASLLSPSTSLTDLLDSLGPAAKSALFTILLDKSLIIGGFQSCRSGGGSNETKVCAAVGLVNLLKSLLPSLSAEQLGSVARATEPADPELLPIIKSKEFSSLGKG